MIAVPDEITLAINDTLWVIAEISGTVMLPCLALGLGVAVFQAATQINEQSLSFIPKLLIIFSILLFSGARLLGLLAELFRTLIEKIPLII